MFPQLEKMGQLNVRKLWNQMFHRQYDDKFDVTNFDRGKPEVKALIILKKILQFVNLYRLAYEHFRKAKSDTVATEMVTQRSVEEIINRVVSRDRSLYNFDMYKHVIKRYMHERFEDTEVNDQTVASFLKD